MPIVVVHTNTNEQSMAVATVFDELTELTANLLSSPARSLATNEVSIRIIESVRSRSIADIELIISAYSYEQRVKGQDRIAFQVKEFLSQKIPDYSFFVWLQLSELGHSILE